MSLLSWSIIKDMTENIEETFKKLMDSYDYTSYDSCNDLMDNGHYHQLSAPGFL